MLLLDGKKVRDAHAHSLKERVGAFASQPALAIIQVGDLKESNSYIGMKKKFALETGISLLHKTFPVSASEKDIRAEIEVLNKDTGVHGIIVQMPLPSHLSATLVEVISPEKDVDGMTAANFKLLAEGTPRYVPATTRGILSLLDFYKIEVAGKKAVVVGRSMLVGKPTALALLNRDATVTLCHSKTADLSQETKSAVILVVAVGQPKCISAGHVSPGAIVIDVGINASESTKLIGDVDFDAVKEVAGAISPVPGGVGPMTVVSLFENVADAYEKHTNN